MNIDKKFRVNALCGVFFGIVFAALLAFQFPNLQQNGGAFSLILEVTFGRFFTKHPIAILFILGALVGAAAGGFRAYQLSKQKKWFAVLSVFLSGILTGGVIIYFTLIRLADRTSTIWELNASQMEALAILRSLKTIDQGTTNDFERLQSEGRSILSNYLHRVDSATNEKFIQDLHSSTYKVVQKYLNPDSKSSTDQP